MKSLVVKGSIVAIVIAIGGLWAFWSMSQTGPGASGDDAKRERELREAELDPKKQKQIWDMEHLAFQLEQRFGRVFLQAMLEKKPDQLQFFALNGFQAKLIQQPGKTESHGVLQETHKTGAESSLRSATKSEWAEYIAAYVNPFAKIAGKTLRVLQLHQDPTDAHRWTATLYLNIFGMNDKHQPIEVKTEHLVRCRVGEPKSVGTTAILESWRVKSEVYRESKQFLMDEVTKEYGLDTVPIRDNWKSKVKQNHISAIAVDDFNRDGYLDIVVGLKAGRPILLRSVDGKRFQSVASAVGVVNPHSETWDQSTPVCWIDFDNDDYPDLLVGKRLFRNIRGKRFEDVSAQSGLHIHSSCMGAVVADYDGDGLLDLYFVHERPDDEAQGLTVSKKKGYINDSETGEENRLWRNLGNGRFRDVTKASRAGGGTRNTFAAAWFFYDADHLPDLYLANDFGENVLLRNRGDGTFEDASKTSGATGFATSMGVVTGDIDNDGQSDVYVANMFSKMGRRIIGQLCDNDYPAGIFSQLQGSCAGNRLYLRKQSSTYRDFSTEMGVNTVGWAFAPAMFDVDGDGWLDLYATTGFISAERNEPDG